MLRSAVKCKIINNGYSVLTIAIKNYKPRNEPFYLFKKANYLRNLSNIFVRASVSVSNVDKATVEALFDF